MTREEFDVLIQRLEGVARRPPGFYLAQIAQLVALAYGYLALILPKGETELADKGSNPSCGRGGGLRASGGLDEHQPL